MKRSWRRDEMKRRRRRRRGIMRRWLIMLNLWRRCISQRCRNENEERWRPWSLWSRTRRRIDLLSEIMIDIRSHQKVLSKEPENSHYLIQLDNSLIENIQSLSLISRRRRLIGRSLRMKWCLKRLQRKLLSWLIGCLTRETNDRKQTIILLDSQILIGELWRRLRIYLTMRN